ncbi:MAG: SH3 domain-containing protein, partial [Bacillota bacterium]
MKKNCKALSLATALTMASVMSVSTVAFAAEKTVNTAFLNVRSSASPEASILGVLKKGDVINISDVTYGWNQFTYNGQTAFVDGNFLTGDAVVVEKPTAVVAPTPAPVAGAVTKAVNVHSVNFRAEPSNDAAIIGVIFEGTVVSATEDEYGWNKVVYDGKTGYVYGKYLTATDGVVVAPAPEPVVVPEPEPVVVPEVVEEEVVEEEVVEEEVVEEVVAEEEEVTEEVEAEEEVTEEDEAEEEVSD